MRTDWEVLREHLMGRHAAIRLGGYSFVALKAKHDRDHDSGKCDHDRLDRKYSPFDTRLGSQ